MATLDLVYDEAIQVYNSCYGL